MQLTIDDSKLTGLNAIVSRLNSVEGSDQITPEAYLQARIEQILTSYDQQILEEIKQANQAFFDLAASLPPEKQDQLKAIVQQLASS